LYGKNIKMEKISFKSLSREIKISPKSLLIVEEVSDTETIGTVEISIGKGKAKLTLDGESLKSLSAGGVIKITTAKDFKQKIK
jgi:hypothetical protein